VLDLQVGDNAEELELPAALQQICHFLGEHLPAELKPLVESTARPLLSRHLTNSFGIWELPVGPDSENLGSAMYPSASYFNHSCEPNLIKLRQGRTVRFVACRDIQCDEELCISYGQGDSRVDVRNQELRKWWGFDCDCTRCKREILDNENTIQQRQNP